MERYNEKSKCCKCGNLYISINYVGGVGTKFVDCIRRNCQRCGYSWYEEPLDVEIIKDNK